MHDGALANRYLWGPQVDQLLAEEQIVSGTSSGPVYWTLGDHLNSVRDVVQYENGQTVIVEHRQYDSFGNVLADDNPSLTMLFSFTGRYFDIAIGLQHNWLRWYDPQIGKWISEDPIGFKAGDTNLGRMVSNNPLWAIDPEGLSEEWAWNWHHMLDQAIFNSEFLRRHGIKIDINDSKYGWMLRAKDHTGAGGVHSAGWSDAWKRWIKTQEDAGVTITEDMINKQLELMKKGFKPRQSHVNSRKNRPLGVLRWLHSSCSACVCRECYL
jgi:RHS repeat-associated protein